MTDEPDKVERLDRRDAERPHLLFGEALVRARENLHLERPEVAARADISYPMLANIETGRRRASDDIIERLAPVIGIPADRMRAVRDADDHMRLVRNSWAHGQARAVELWSHLNPKSGSPPASSEASDNDGEANPSVVERLLSDMLVEQQLNETYALAARPRIDVAFPHSQRMQITSDILRDLGLLDDTDLAKVRGYVDGLRAARDQAATAVSPKTDVPLIRVPDEPFGPLTPWLMPDWIKNVRRVDLSRRAREARMLLGFSKFASGAGTLLAAGPNDDARPLPCNNHNEAAEAVRVGERLAQFLAKRAGGNPGMIAAGDWRSLAILRVYRAAEPRKAETLNWVVRVGAVATLLWPDDIDARIDFVKRCISLYKDQASLLDDE
jgi:transcriptional regulator with XRE-family HTH domain